MTKTLAQINKEIETLQRKAEALRKSEAAEVIERVKEAIRHYGLTAKDLGLARKSSAPGRKKRGGLARAKGAAKYRDPATGRTWTGHGRRPQWFADGLAKGKQPEDFAA